ncbi:uncharacterized protein MELLADRAFT_48926 [Melampsora larici-populina 98AG31]|uniref:RRM domain-containing protein n=1 Tax=Melampsora larici-populina (strain 98AG31 / pathotype 3-4-7) TaxID=747676 RepID=F4RR95_MELLP|nr:uncharacterized protein MELLADRAFT_48926 [Melampsora larici-populina 98AG31]EGG05191.1 hypothetical protein MELLADRAFT_48926 [Melampsora larici-populina 98AG31]
MEAQPSEQPTPSSSTSNTNTTNDQTQPPPSPSSLDPRIHFDQTNNRWEFEADDGKEYEWIEAAQSWVPIIDQSLWTAQQAAYNLHGHPDDQIRQQANAERKEKQKRMLGTEDGTGKKNEAVRNTAVYVSRLPLDVKIDEIHETFSKAGLVLVDEENRPKIKLYEDEQTGRFNGTALIVYLKVESVELAIKLFDESSLRIGKSELMKVSRAQFSEKKSNLNSTIMMNDSKKKKQKLAKKVDQLKSKLEEWDSEDEESLKKDSRMVVLKYMFTVEELAQDPSLLIDLKEDVREECELLGNVTNVTLYDLEEEGIMTVKFKEPIAAQACILKMNNRFFAGRQVQAMIDDRSRRFKKSNHHQSNEKDGEEDEKKRLDGFAKYLESAE